MNSETNKTYAYNRQVFLSILDEFDVKGKYSGKNYVWYDGRPHDILGVVLERLGYTPPHPYLGHDSKRDIIFGCNMDGLYYEIDRPGSTNESIKAFVIKIFNKNKLETTEENNVS